MTKLNLNKKNKDLLRRNLKLVTMSVFLTTATLGCLEEEASDIPVSDNIIDTNVEAGKIEPIVSTIKVPGEKFNIEAEYTCIELGDKYWRITSDKKIQMKVCTKDLPEDTKVWIDNVHIDTTTVATKKEMDGITQDSMDDHIHNSNMMGFPISNDINYYGINCIEGQNESFIHGTCLGINGINHTELNEKRYLESDYLSRGVYANHMSIIYGLLIQGPNDLEPRGVDVHDDVYITICDTIEFKKEDKGSFYRRYNLDGSFEDFIEKPKIKEK